jgi:hypothetical protein
VVQFSLVVEVEEKVVKVMMGAIAILLVNMTGKR